MLEKSIEGKISIPQLVHKMAHAPAILFRIKDRGFIREGYFADLVEVDATEKTQVHKDTLFYKCGWSPFEGIEFNHQIKRTFVNGNIVYQQGKIIEGASGERLLFNYK
jgi:dihydroorotase